MAVIIAVKPKVPAEQAARTAAKNDPTPDDKAMEEMRKQLAEKKLQDQLNKGYEGATGGKKAGGTVKYARGGGIEQRGKTRGKIV